MRALPQFPMNKNKQETSVWMYPKWHNASPVCVINGHKQILVCIVTDKLCVISEALLFMHCRCEERLGRRALVQAGFSISGHSEVSVPVRFF